MKFDIACLISGRETEGRMVGFEERVPAHSGPPLHAHREQIEVFHIIEGRFLFECAGERCELGAGGCITIPKGAAHAFRNVGDSVGRIHFELLPAGRSETFFRRLVAESDRIDDFGAFFDEHDIELLGPPIE